MKEGRCRDSLSAKDCCKVSLDMIGPLHTNSQQLQLYACDLHQIKSAERPRPLAEALADGFCGKDSLFPSGMWPLLGYSCSNRWPDIQHILVALTRFSELKRKKKLMKLGGRYGRGL